MRVIISHIDHGKTTLTAATQLLSHQIFIGQEKS